MARPKNLPDHSTPSVIPLNYERFSEEDVEYLRDEFNFDDEYPLEEALEHAFDNYHLFSVRKAPTAGQKVLLKELIDCSNRLLNVLRKLGLQETASIAFHSRTDTNKEMVQTHVRRYSYAAESVLKQLTEKTASGGRPRNLARDALIRDLYAIYRVGTGNNKKITFDPYSGSYKGPFFEFADYCFDHIGVWIENQTLGKAIAESLARMEKTSR